MSKQDWYSSVGTEEAARLRFARQSAGFVRKNRLGGIAKGRCLKFVFAAIAAAAIGNGFCSCVTLTGNPDAIIGYRNVDSPYAQKAKQFIGKTVIDASKEYGQYQSRDKDMVVFNKQRMVTAGEAQTISASVTDTRSAAVSNRQGTAAVGASKSGTAGAASTSSYSETVAVDDGVIFYTSNDKITSYKLLGRPEKDSIPIVKEGGEEYKINWPYSMSMTYLYILLFPITVPFDLVTAITRSDGSKDLVKELQESANAKQQGVGKEKNIAIGIITYSMWKLNRKKFLATAK